MTKSNIKTLVQLLGLSALVALSFSAKSQHFTPLNKLQFVERVIENYYVDTVNANKMVEEGIVAMLKTLDPHSQYSNPEETRELNEPLQGNFSGIGIQFNMATDTVYVIQTISGGPSEKVGIVAGDRIIAANDTVLAGRKLRNTEVMKHLRGPKGSEVKLSVVRKGVAQPIEFMVTRDEIPIYSVDASFMAAPKVGYIRVSRFAESTVKEVQDAIKKLQKQGMRDLILDLEDNGGGYLNAAKELAELFLNKDDLIVYTKGNAMPAQYLRSSSKPMMSKGKVVVMVNQYSASASEILSGAIQDHDRGLIVGRRTYGKGLVQRPFPMPDGSMIRLTVARYYTPSGRSIQKPYNPGDSEGYSRDIVERYKHGELMNADSIQQHGKMFRTLKRHRPVYEGGGITPDLFVGVDTAYYSDYYRDLVAKGVLNKYVVNYVDKNRQELLGEYGNIERFISDFNVGQPMIDGLVAMGEADGVKFNEEQFERSRPTMETIVKALIARDVFDDGSSYYMVANKLNPTYREALNLIQDDNRYNSLLSNQE